MKRRFVKSFARIRNQFWFKPGTKVRVRYWDNSGHLRWSGVRVIHAMMDQKMYPGGRMIDKPVSDCSYWNVLDFKRAS